MASLGSFLPSPGSAVWRRDRSNAVEQHGGANRVRHAVIRDAEIWDAPTTHVVYRIDVLTEDNHWYLHRRYSQFHTLHGKLVKQYGVSRDLLPPKKISGNLSKSLIDKRRQLLERYLQKLIHSDPQVSQSLELQTFLDVPCHDVVRVVDILTRHLWAEGDRLLEKTTPIALSVNEMFAISQRLRMPRDAQGTDASDVASDPAHLYSFLHQLCRLRVSLPPPPSSVCCMPFEMAHFRSLTTLKLDGVPLSQVHGLVAVQAQMTKLSVHRSSLHSLRELLIDAVEEKRKPATNTPPSSPSTPSSPSSPSTPPLRRTESWRLTALAKLTDNRIVVQPWLALFSLSLTHNKITHLDESLQVLPSLKELNLSHNLLQVLRLQYLCLPSLEKVSLAHNALQRIEANSKVLEKVMYLNISHNRLHSLEGIHAFVAVETINLVYNLVASHRDLDRLSQLRRLSTLSLAGNPILGNRGARILLLAKFFHKSKVLSLDGLQPTHKEKIKIQSLTDQFGTKTEDWPMAKSISNPDEDGGEGKGEGEGEGEGGNRPHLDLCWRVHSTDDQRGRPLLQMTGSSGPDSPVLRIPSPNQSLLSQESLDPIPLMVEDLAPHHLALPPPGASYDTEEKYAVGSLLSFECMSAHDREEPDGQSDISTASPDFLLARQQSSDPPSHTLTPPPSTPLTSNGNYKPNVTPTMILSALDALQQIRNKDTPLSLTPCDETPMQPIFPEAITSALTAWISSQNSGDTPLVSPPPSTPMESSSDRCHHAISASDLIAALSALIPPAQDSEAESGDSSVACTAPQGTPQEGLSEWARLGIRPEEVIQALSALTIPNAEEEGEGSHSPHPLSPISEEMPPFVLEGRNSKEREDVEKEEKEKEGGGERYLRQALEGNLFDELEHAQQSLCQEVEVQTNAPSDGGQLTESISDEWVTPSPPHTPPITPSPPHTPPITPSPPHSPPITLSPPHTPPIKPSPLYTPPVTPSPPHTPPSPHTPPITPSPPHIITSTPHRNQEDTVD